MIYLIENQQNNETKSATKLILIIGAHRSGTSLLAKAVEVTGADLGDNLLPANFDNPRGFMEDREVFSLNEAILDALNRYWDAPTTLYDFDPQDPSLSSYRERLRTFVTRRCSEARTFSIKDPRLCVLLPFWLSVADEMGLPVQFVISVRNPLDVAHSLSQRDGFPIEKGIRLWLNWYYAALTNLLDRKEKKIFVSYDNLLDNPEREICRLGRALSQGQADYRVDEYRLQEFIAVFADKSLRHSQAERSSLEQQYALYGIGQILPIYDLLLAFCEGHWSKQKVKMLLSDLSRRDLEYDNFSVHLGYFKRQRHEVHVLRQKLEKLTILHTERESELERLERLAEVHQQEIQQLQFRQNDLLLSYGKLRQAKDIEIATLKSTVKQLTNAQEKLIRKAEEDIQQITWQRATEIANLENDLTAVQASLSYRLGRLGTWPARKVYDAFFESVITHPQNLILAKDLLVLGLRHPVKFAQLVNWERVRNAYITFFRKPSTAGSVVSYYLRVVGKAPLGSPSSRNQASSAVKRLPKLKPQPKISVLVVNYNGRTHLPDLLNSLRRQTYRKFEVIVVDNCSKDDSVEWITLHNPKVRVVALQNNLGFAAGNNVASEMATGDLYCLLNNDTEVEPDWLEQLVNCMAAHPNAGAVGPKILFWKRFLPLHIEVRGASGKSGQIKVDVSALEESARVYPKIFYKSGFSMEQDVDERRIRTLEERGEILFPVCEGQLSMNLNLLTIGEQKVEVRVSTREGGLLARLEASPHVWKQASVDLSAVAGEAACVINNAASVVTSSGEVFDRGFGELDLSQFAAVEKVDALCGCSMLIRPEVLEGKPIFADQFFAYFEDTDLSLRIRESGFDLVYCPESVVYHKHAFTSKEYSPFFRFHVARNRVLFFALHFPEQFWKDEHRKAQLHLNHLHSYYTKEAASQVEKEFAKMIPKIFADWKQCLPAIQEGNFYARERVFPKIGIYNNFWYTLGGGEHHAGVMAQWLQRYGLVDLISENDFNIEDIERKFNLNLKGCRKRCVSPLEIHHQPEFTQEYSLFINSTFGSDLKCHSPVSFYVVSFPYNLSGRPKENREFVHTYTGFLCNSHYTQEWTRRYWGVTGDILYPSVILPKDRFSFENKERIILNVGRFFSDGHCKKQLELVRAFIAMERFGLLRQNWRLVLVGNVSPEHVGYLRAIKRAAEGHPIEILENLALEKLQWLYRKTAIYWHATGLGVDPNLAPDRYEHFGISTVEAMSYGCIPVVINGGGQMETVEEGVTGFLFNNIQDLYKKTGYCIELFEKSPEKFWLIAEQAIRRAHSFDRAHLEMSLDKLVVQYIARLPNGRILN